MSLLKNLFQRSPAQRAGRKAAHSWQAILDQTDEDLETLTGLDLYEHSKEEARKWLQSYYRETYYRWTIPQQRTPELRYHAEFLEYIEAFVSEFPPIHRGNPKSEPHY